MMSDMENQPPGWYRDRVQPNRHRYWDGAHWIGPVGETLDVWARILGEQHDGGATVPAGPPVATSSSLAQPLRWFW